MAREQIDFRADFKLAITFLENNPNFDPEQPAGEGNEQYVIVDPRETRFVINLFSLNEEKTAKDKKTIFQATWDLTTTTNCQFDDVNQCVNVIFNNDPALRALDKGLFTPDQQLQGTIWWAYPDVQMPDDFFNCGNAFDTNIDIVNVDTIQTYEQL